MTVLVISGTTQITEYYSVVRGLRLPPTDLALGSEQDLVRLPPLGALGWFRYGGYECDGLVHAAAGLCSCGEWCVGV
jgi:hypothetical protein